MTSAPNGHPPRGRVLIEACVDSVASSVAAERGGAGRLELCDALFDGGTTPSAGMIAACREHVSIPIFVIVRPRGGGFVYSDAELDVMRRDILVARGLGAEGVVIGALRADGTVDDDHTRSLVNAAEGMEVTFHRAFDFAPDLGAALEALVSAGVSRVLSSGGAPSARDGLPTLASLVRQAGDRITVMAGGGIRDNTVREIIDGSGVREIHVRLTRLTRGAGPGLRPGVRVRKTLPDDEAAWEETDEAWMRRFVSVATASANMD